MKLTYRFFIYLAVLALAVAPALLVPSILGYGPVLLLLLSGGLSFLWMCLLRKRLEFDLSTQVQSCVRGETAEFQVRLSNGSLLPAVGVKTVFFISDPDGLDEQVTELYLTLSPKEDRNFGFTASFPHIGTYRAGVRRIELQDAFGIFRVVRGEEKSCRVEVLPRVVPLASLPVSTSVQVESAKTPVQSPLNGSDYTGVREYAFGDPIKHIHWKLSAHAGGLMTKQMESYSNTGVSVVLDLQVPVSDGAVRLDEFDGIIEAGVAAGSYAAERGMDYELLFYSMDGEQVRAVPSSFHALSGVVGEMRLAEPDPQQDIVRMLRENCQGVYSQANIVVCTAVLSRELAEMMVKLKQGGRTPILFLVLSEALTEQERKDRMAHLRKLSHANIACRVLAAAAELEV